MSDDLKEMIAGIMILLAIIAIPITYILCSFHMDKVYVEKGFTRCPATDRALEVWTKPEQCFKSSKEPQ